MRNSHRSCKLRQQANEPWIENNFPHCFCCPPQSYSTIRESLLKGQEQYVASGEHQVKFCHEFWAVDFAWGLKCTIYYLVSPCVHICRRYEAAGIWRALWRAARGIPGATLTSWVLVKLPKCFISRSTRIGACNSQLFWYIFNPVFTVVKRDIPSVRSYTRFRSYTHVICEHDCNIKHACTSEFNFTNLLAIL